MGASNVLKLQYQQQQWHGSSKERGGVNLHTAKCDPGMLAALHTGSSACCLDKLERLLLMITNARCLPITNVNQRALLGDSFKLSVAHTCCQRSTVAYL
jgi:hypothetical protein